MGKPHSVVYHLRGGTGTQKKFFKRQCTELKHIHKILVHTPPDSDPLQNHIPTLSLNMLTVSMLRTSDIFWRSQNSKYSSAIAEYNSTSFNTTPSPSKSPRKSPKAAKHVSFQSPLESSEPGRNTFSEHKVGAPVRVPLLTIKIPPQNQKTKSSTHSDLFLEKTANAAQKDVQPFPDIDTITMKSSSDDPDFSSETKHKSVVWLEQDNVVSALWGQQKKQREIRLGKWHHSTKVPGPQSDEESEFRFNLFPHTEEIDLALAPHHAILDALLIDVGSITQALHVPTLDHLRKKGK
ncbi:hypothetical protein F5051DRAFT_443237 [Lentinula edodes]|nr:hypothetical protein F5051DRAFT_443237 [Lentinula edodes]